jgi:hypothetical protein
LLTESPWWEVGVAGRQTCARKREETGMEFLLWILAVILVISGIVTLIRGGVLWGIVLIIVGLLVGPGGVSLFTR